MADHLEIFLLGRVWLRLNGEPIQAITSHKALALFIYLASHSEPIFRDRLADLLYSNLPQQRVRADLSVLLNRLQPLTAYLHPTRHSIAFHPHSRKIDVGLHNCRMQTMGSAGTTLIYIARRAATTASIPRMRSWDLVAPAVILIRNDGVCSIYTKQLIDYLQLLNGHWAKALFSLTLIQTKNHSFQTNRTNEKMKRSRKNASSQKHKFML